MAHAEAIAERPAAKVEVASAVIVNLDELIVGGISHAITIGIACQITGWIGVDLIDHHIAWIGSQCLAKANYEREKYGDKHKDG
jgi:hypothetical protein